MAGVLFFIVSIRRRLLLRLFGYEDADHLQMSPDDEYVTCTYPGPGVN